MTEDELVDRVRDVCIANGYTEAVGADFTRQPTGTITDGAFTVGLSGTAARGGMNFTEEARATIQVAVVRPLDDDYQQARRQALQDGRTLLEDITRDGAVTSGEYAVEDGRALTVETPRGANYVLLRLSVPVNFEAQL